MSSIASPRQNRKPRPERRLSVGAPCNGVFAISVQVGADLCRYYVEPAPCDYGRAAFKLVKFPCDVKPGEPDAYTVLVGHRKTDSVCPCRGFERHGWHLDADGELVSCRHLDCIFTLEKLGHLQMPAQRPAVNEAESA
jgi:hypothetical protein